MHYQLMLVSNLLMCKRNAIKATQREELFDKSYSSKIAWPVSILSKRNVYYWKRFISSISNNDGLLLQNIRWVNLNNRHRSSLTFRSNDRTHVRVIIQGQERLCKQTRLHNKYYLTQELTHAYCNERVKV